MRDRRGGRARSRPCGRRPRRPRDLDEAAVRDLPDAARLGGLDGQGGPARAARPHPDPAAARRARRGARGARRLVAGRRAVAARRPATSAATPAGCGPRTSAPRSTGRTGRPPTVAAASATAPVDDGPASSCRSAPCCGCASVDRGPATRGPARRPDRHVARRRPCGSADKGERPPTARRRCSRRPAQFLGVRYLWGGTSAWGLDCSGLVHLSWRGQGVLLPRDAHDQAAAAARRDGAAGRRTAGRPVLLRPAGRADLPRRLRDPPGRGRRHPLDAARAGGRRADRGRAPGAAPRRDLVSAGRVAPRG